MFRVNVPRHTSAADMGVRQLVQTVASKLDLLSVRNNKNMAAMRSVFPLKYSLTTGSTQYIGGFGGASMDSSNNRQKPAVDHAPNKKNVWE